MTPSRKKPGVAFWATVVVVMGLVGYPLSFGPACWIATRTGTAEAKPFVVAYWPIWMVINQEVPIAGDAFSLYAVIGMRSGAVLKIPFELGITEISRN